jgi:hypothetical protein
VIASVVVGPPELATIEGRLEWLFAAIFQDEAGRVAHLVVGTWSQLVAYTKSHVEAERKAQDGRN